MRNFNSKGKEKLDVWFFVIKTVTHYPSLVLLPMQALGLHWDPLQTQNHWHPGPTLHLPLQQGWVRTAGHQRDWGLEAP